MGQLNERRRRGENLVLNTPPAKPQITPQITALVARALEVQQAALHEPFHFELDTCVDEVVEVAVRVLEGEGVRVDKVLGD